VVSSAAKTSELFDVVVESNLGGVFIEEMQDEVVGEQEFGKLRRVQEAYIILPALS
jgi:hypothetical protein